MIEALLHGARRVLLLLFAALSPGRCVQRRR
jgi:hypothetical protein